MYTYFKRPGDTYIVTRTVMVTMSPDSLNSTKWRNRSVLPKVLEPGTILVYLDTVVSTSLDCSVARFLIQDHVWMVPVWYLDTIVRVIETLEKPAESKANEYTRS